MRRTVSFWVILYKSTKVACNLPWTVMNTSELVYHLPKYQQVRCGAVLGNNLHTMFREAVDQFQWNVIRKNGWSFGLRWYNNIHTSDTRGGVFRKLFGEKWPRYSGSALYWESVVNMEQRPIVQWYSWYGPDYPVYLFEYYCYRYGAGECQHIHEMFAASADIFLILSHLNKLLLICRRVQ